MDGVAKLLIVGGVVLAVAGAVLWGAARLGLGRLPGDVVINRGSVHIAFPVVTSILVSLVLTIVLNIAVRVFR